MKVVLPEGIETAAVDALEPYARNARTHSADQVDQIAASILEFGFNAPVGIRGNRIGVGHGRVLAAKRLGLDRVPIVRLDHLTDAQFRAYVLADNQLALNAGWDMRLLAQELARLDHEDFNLDLLGFSPLTVQELLAGLEDMPSSLDLAPAMTAAPAPVERQPRDRREPAKGRDVSAPADGGNALVLAMDPEDRDLVLAYLAEERDARGLDDVADALVALAREAA